MNRTKIEYADYTWNPVAGCKNSCEYCYARGIAKRFGGGNCISAKQHGYGAGAIFELPENEGYPYPFGFAPTFHRYRLGEPQRKEKPQTIFVCSMADLFGPWVPDGWVQEVFDACAAAPWHRYLFLTKFPKTLTSLAWRNLPRKSNYWYGTSITAPEEKSWYSGCHNVFLSIEPLLADMVWVNLADIKWVIVGAETGNRAGKIIPKREWVEKIVEQCRRANVPVFLKDNLADVWGGPLIQELPWA